MQSRLLTIIKYLIGWPLSLLALFFIYRLVSPHTASIFERLTDSNWPILLLGIFFFVCYFFLRAAAWHIAVQEKAPEIPFRESLYIWGMAEMQRYIPGTIWSFVGRTTRYTKKGLEKKDIVIFLGFEIAVMGIGAAWVSMLGFHFMYERLFSFPLPEELLFTVIFVSLSFITLFFIHSSLFVKKIPEKLQSFTACVIPQTTVTVLLLTLLAFFSFGLANYFVFASLVYLSPQNILSFIGFFAFSLLVGYISFITPVGLGVREGILTIGFSSLLPLALAGFLGIFSRLVLIMSEGIFLGIVFTWHKLPSSHIRFAEAFVSKHKYVVLLTFFVGMYLAYFVPITFLRYDNFYTGRFDLGNMTQTVWNTSQGRIFQMTHPDTTEVVSRLAFHADFILIFLAPFYLLWSDPRMLLLLQTIIVASGAVFVYLIADTILKNKKLSVTLAGIYLLNPSLQYANLYDFHAVTLATTFLLGAFYFLHQKKYFLFLLFALLAAFTKEQVWAVIGLFGVYEIIRMFLVDKHPGKFLQNNSKRILLWTLYICLSVALFYYLVSYAIPQAKGTNHFALEYYADFGSSPMSIITNVLFSPHKIIETVFQPEKLSYLRQLFMPLGFLPLLAPEILLFALPDLLINMLSNNTQLHQIYFQYTATITPFLFIATIFSIKKLQQIFPKIPANFFIIYLIISTLYGAYITGPLPGAKSPNLDMITKPQADKQLINQTLSQIPKEYSVAASNNLGSHLSHREYIYTIPVGLEQADVIAFLLNDPFAQPSPQAQREMVNVLKNDTRYILVVEKGKFVVFKRK